MENTDLKSTHEGKLPIGNMEIECHVLSDGTRVFTSRDLLKALNLQSNQKDQPRVLMQFIDKLKLYSIGNNELSNPITNHA